MAATRPIGSRDDPIVGPGETGTTSPPRSPVLPRPRTPDDESARIAASAAPTLSPPLPAAEPNAPESPDAVAPFLELLEDVLAGRSLLGSQRQGIRERIRRWLVPVGTFGEPLILFCGWLSALVIALAAYADVGPFSGSSDAVLMLAAEAVLTIAVLGALALAKARRRARADTAGQSAAAPDDRSRARG